MLKKALMTAAAAAAIGVPGLTPTQQALAAEAEPAPPYTLTGNVGVFSQYIFRGLSQTNRDPAIQGGFDFAHESGFYLGTWASNISWLRENSTINAGGAPFVMGSYSGGGSMEWDFYGGYKWGFAEDWTLDVGTLYYWYPGTTNQIISAANNAVGLPSVPRANTWEIYAALSWKWLSAKYSYSVDNKTFGVLDSTGTWYLDLSANAPLGEWVGLPGLNLQLHWGWQKYSGTDARNAYFSSAFVGGPAPYPTTPSNDELYSYKDVKIGLTYTLPKDFVIGAFWSQAYDYNKLGYGSYNDLVYTSGGANYYGPFPKDIGKSTGTVFIQKTF